MFKFSCCLEEVVLDHVIKDIRNFVKENGGISKKELIGRMAPHIAIHPGDDKIGWGYAQIIYNGFCREFDPEKNCWMFVLDDPVELNIPSKFDVISHPSHYTEGRTYEPRKVIADWGLNFNLGNAVKYLSRAGRKGDKIKDLRKAIQYIDFEIEELEGKKDE